MGIQRYSASIDTTITNAYKMNLTTRATGSNMGLADTLETFSIYGQASSASSELSRILVQFPINSIQADRTSGVIPASGSASFFLKMYNAEHSHTLPRDFTLNIAAVSSSWEEGYGLDMDEYTDLTYDDVGANWIQASSGSVAATATITVSATDVAYIGDGDTIQLISTDSQTVTLTIQGTGGSTTSAETSGDTLTAKTLSAGSYANAALHATAQADEIMRAINYHTKFTATKSSNVITVTQATPGAGGKTAITITELGATGLSKTDFTGGGNDWSTEGGDYYTDTSSSFTASFKVGTEDLEIDISPLVEQWLSASTDITLTTTDINIGKKTNYGLGIKFFGADETAARSYYTKKFFARDSQYFLKRPIIEARWDSTIRDDTGYFFLSSSLAPSADNLNTIYMYNRVRGQLKNIPTVDEGVIWVSLYSGSLDNTTTSGSKLFLPKDGVHVVSEGDTEVTGGYAMKTGWYTASFSYASSSITTIFPVWHFGGVVYRTGSAIEVNTFDSADHNPHPSYVSKITNLKDTYSRDEKMTRFRLYVREKDWNPNIYAKASSDISTSIIENAYYRIYRTIDEFEVVGYGTGSANHTRLSYDASGSYFDFPVDILESGYMYAFQFVYKMPDGNYREQPEVFKFRVEE